MNGKIKVLIVDDSAIVRKILSESLSGVPGIEVVGTAPDPYVARDKILALKPDIITLDIEMPRMDGLTFLKKIMRHNPVPVIVISSLTNASCQTALEALRLGAVEVLGKPNGPYSVGDLSTSLAAKVRAAAAARQRSRIPAQFPPSPALPPPDLAGRTFDPNVVIAIGASTGGTEAIETILTAMPAACPGMVIVQHIPPVFSLAFANRLNRICAMQVKEAQDGDIVEPGKVLIAPGDFHMVLRASAGGPRRVSVKTGPLVCYQRPSVDVLFHSVADAMGPQTIGVLLTGMGSDGARGLARIKQTGGRTIAQDEASCVVFGMPKEAIRLGGADQVLSLHRIAPAVLFHAESRLTQPRDTLEAVHGTQHLVL